jgi:TrmH family RNA methyltransferase
MLERVRIVLVEPQHPGNVGAAARAMVNMGLSDLVVVDPPALDMESARWMAPGCESLLSELRIVSTVAEAIADCHVCVATTARHRRRGQPVHTPAELAQRVRQQDDRTFALLFGREDFGLSTEDVLAAEALLRIPTPEHASLNLAQAVLLVSHAFFEEARSNGQVVATGRTLGGSRGRRTTASKSKRSKRDAPAELARIQPAVDEVVELLDTVGYFRGTPHDKVRLSASHALQSGGFSIRHVEALRGMVNRVRWALDHPDADWRATRSEQSTDD